MKERCSLEEVQIFEHAWAHSAEGEKNEQGPV